MSMMGALALDGIDRGVTALGERMAAAVLTVPANEHLVGGLQEEHLAAHLTTLELGDAVEQLVEEPLAAQIAGNGQMAAHACVDAHELGQLQDQARGQVVDAEVAHVLEHVHRLGAA